MKFNKILSLVIIIFLLDLALGGIWIYKKNTIKKTSHKNDLNVSTENWIDHSNAKYGYEVWCPPDFTCQFVCNAGNVEEEQFCANPTINSAISLYMSEQPLSSSNLTANIFNGQSIVVAPNNSILDNISARILALGATKLDTSRYNITGVARIDGFTQENTLDSKTSHIEEWFFVKNNLLYHATIKYDFDMSTKDATQKSADILHQIFNTVGF